MFIVELWESIFTPGTTPALITATHASFILLIISLIVFFFLTKSIHFFNLFIIAVLLYGTVVWFINEIKQIKLKDNEELERDQETPKATSTQVETKDIKPKKRKV